jgi:hypothetical protein
MSVGVDSVARMPSHLHEVLIEMFRDRPELAAEVLAGPLGVPMPAFRRAEVSSSELTDVMATEYRADAVITLSGANGLVLAVIIEVQLRVDTRKRRTWPAYVTTLHARLGCPVVLLVVCPKPAVATWCSKPISIGHPGLILTPLVLGPDAVPVVTDADAARRHPHMTVLSALAHGARPGLERVLDALLAALDVIDHDHASLYADVVLAELPAAAHDYLEALMTATPYRYQSDFARRYFDQGQTEGKAEGKAEGRAAAVLDILDARGVPIEDDMRADIAACTDLPTLDVWIRRAITAATVRDLFD